MELKGLPKSHSTPKSENHSLAALCKECSLGKQKYAFCIQVVTLQELWEGSFFNIVTSTDMLHNKKQII